MCIWRQKDAAVSVYGPIASNLLLVLEYTAFYSYCLIVCVLP